MRKLAQDFGIRLKEARKSAGLSQTELAGPLGTHQVYISLLEHAPRIRHYRHLLKYAKALDQKAFLAFSGLHADEPEVDTKDLRLLELMTKHEAMLDELARVRAVLREGSGKNSAVTSKLLRKILQQNKNKY